MKQVVSFFCWLMTLPRQRVRYGMALIKLGGGVADIRGSIGGTVFSRNRSGAIARNRTVPVNPASAKQTKIRSVMSVVRNAWYNTLTAAQRTAWDSYAEAVEVQNRLGESIKLTGWNHFCRSAACLLYNDLAIVADGPTEMALPEQDGTISITASAASGEISVAFDDEAAWLDETGSHLLVYASRGQAPTINFFKGPYQIAGTVDGDDSTPPTTPATITAPFTLIEGQKVFCQFRIVRADGRLSAPFRASCVIGA